jgi:toxin ParE1/3/4
MSANSRRYILSPLAEIDLEDIWVYTLQNWSLDQADKYQAELIAAIEALASGNKVGREASDIRGGYMKYAVGRHFLFYRLTGDDVDVIRILHRQMDVSAHLAR